MPPITLKIKGNKSFLPFFAMATADELQRTWRVCTRVKDSLENGSRLENLSWRLWFLQNKQKAFNAKKSKKLATVLEAKLETIPEKLADIKKKQGFLVSSSPVIPGSSPRSPSFSPAPVTAATTAVASASAAAAAAGAVAAQKSVSQEQEGPAAYPLSTIPTSHVLPTGNFHPNATQKNQNLSIHFQSDGGITLSGQIEDLFGDFGSMFGGDFDIEAPAEVGWEYAHYEGPSSHAAAATTPQAIPKTPSASGHTAGTPSSDPHNSISLALLEAAETCEHIPSPSPAHHRFLWGDPTLSQNAIRPPPAPHFNSVRPHSTHHPEAHSSPSPLPSGPHLAYNFHRPSYSLPVPPRAVAPGDTDHSGKLHQPPQPQQQQSQKTRISSGSSSAPHPEEDSEAAVSTGTCMNCQAMHTPLWRRSHDGKMLCNACGLYVKSHNQARPKQQPLRKDGKPAGDLECANCKTTTTPLWRRTDAGEILCNACGLYMKLHNEHRPVSMKTDVIKKRNRTSDADKSSKRKKTSPPAPEPHLKHTSHTNGYRSAMPSSSSSSSSSGQPNMTTAQMLVPSNLAPPSMSISRGQPVGSKREIQTKADFGADLPDLFFVSASTAPSPRPLGPTPPLKPSPPLPPFSDLLN